MKNILIKIMGYPITLIHGDCAVLDRWRWLKKHLLPGALRTLDAGCGSGAFAMYAAKIGNEAVGISFEYRNNIVAAERAKILGIPNVSFIDGDLRKLNQMLETLGKFNQIICCETIEHILDDKKLIKDFSSLLKTDGRLLLTTPYKGYKPLYGDRKTGLSILEDGGHVRWGYTHEEMTALLNEFGFEIKTAEYVTGFISQQLINLERVLCGFNPRLAWAVVFPLRVFQLLDPLVSKIIGYPHLSIGVVAVKK